MLRVYSSHSDYKDLLPSKVQVLGRVRGNGNWNKR
jgi:hypothetical protein